MMQRILSTLLAFMLLLSLLPASALAAGGTTYTVPDGADLREFLEKNEVQDGDVVNLTGEGFVNDTSDTRPWVINKQVTIRGGWIQMRAKGILLGADVTFDGVQLGFAVWWPDRSLCCSRCHSWFPRQNRDPGPYLAGQSLRRQHGQLRRQ